MQSQNFVFLQPFLCVFGIITPNVSAFFWAKISWYLGEFIMPLIFTSAPGSKPPQSIFLLYAVLFSLFQYNDDQKVQFLPYLDHIMQFLLQFQRHFAMHFVDFRKEVFVVNLPKSFWWWRCHLTVDLGTANFFNLFIMIVLNNNNTNNIYINHQFFPKDANFFFYFKHSVGVKILSHMFFFLKIKQQCCRNVFY